ncbi:MAG: hypothetical protein KF869_12930 [Phycisphaeraceae bacterium]|nr:hypothetical protein [Phycisphaeraceae bacterium]
MNASRVYFAAGLIAWLASSNSQAQCEGQWVTTAAGGGWPAARSGHAMAYDPVRGRTVLFGGSGLGGSMDPATWEWDGTSWTMVHAGGVGAPSPRIAPAMKFLPSINKVVLFGGLSSPNFLDDTWTWDGATWVQIVGAAPPGRTNAGITRRPFPSDQLVLFGGQGTGGFLNDTWTFNGVAWTQLTPFTSPPPVRSQHAMAYHGQFHAVVVYGGIGNTGYLGDTWMLIGDNWLDVGPICAPGPLAGASLSYDPARNTMLLNGGLDGTFFKVDSWVFEPRGTLAASTWRKVVGVGLSGWAAQRGGAPGVFDSARGRHVVFSGFGGFFINDLIEFVAPDLSVTRSPTEAVVAPTGNATFAVSTGAPGPLSYQWRRNGVPLADGPTVQGSATNTLTVGPLTLADDNGAYDCIVTTGCGQLRSDPIALGVANPCAADFDDDGTLGVPDIFAFLSAWFAGCP